MHRDWCALLQFVSKNPARIGDLGDFSMLHFQAVCRFHIAFLLFATSISTQAPRRRNGGEVLSKSIFVPFAIRLACGDTYCSVQSGLEWPFRVQPRGVAGWPMSIFVSNPPMPGPWFVRWACWCS